MGYAERTAPAELSQVLFCTQLPPSPRWAPKIFATLQLQVARACWPCRVLASRDRALRSPAQYAKRVITFRDGLQLGSAAKSGGTKTADRQHYASADGPKRRWHRLAGHMGCVAVFLLFLWSIRVTRRHFRHPHRKVSCCPLGAPTLLTPPHAYRTHSPEVTGPRRCGYILAVTRATSLLRTHAARVLSGRPPCRQARSFVLCAADGGTEPALGAVVEGTARALGGGRGAAAPLLPGPALRLCRAGTGRLPACCRTRLAATTDPIAKLDCAASECLSFSARQHSASAHACACCCRLPTLTMSMP